MCINIHIYIYTCTTYIIDPHPFSAALAGPASVPEAAFENREVSARKRKAWPAVVFVERTCPQFL